MSEIGPDGVSLATDVWHTEFPDLIVLHGHATDMNVHPTADLAANFLRCGINSPIVLTVTEFSPHNPGQALPLTSKDRRTNSARTYPGRNLAGL